MEQAVTKTELEGLKFLTRGKVRDLYDAGEHLLFVATDRVSAFDWVLPTGIPGKGKMLTAISSYWFDFFEDIENHRVTDKIDEMPEEVQKHRDILDGRTMLVKKAEVIPVECIVRGYIAGSGWKEYQQSQSICGIKLPAGLKRGDKLEEPIFTPTTKAEVGHDEAITFEDVVNQVGTERAEELRTKSIEVYRRARELADTRGILLADTKFEWGIIDGKLILVDEVLTPDSSRFWPKEGYHPGEEQPSFDKQFIRDYLLSTDWDRKSTPPALPDDIVGKTVERYHEAYRRLVGETQGGFDIRDGLHSRRA